MTKLTAISKAKFTQRNACVLTGMANLSQTGCSKQRLAVACPAPGRDGIAFPARVRNSGRLSETKRFLLITIILMSALSWLSANTLRVALDGSQTYTVIQEAINASAQGDTVLVYPGRYYENIRFYGKNITLASLELTTGNLDYKYNTIIDGNQNGSAVYINDSESFVTLRGFTLTNGSGTYYANLDQSLGGGILVGSMINPVIFYIINCVIEDNEADTGGGICVSASNIYLSGVSIVNNNGVTGGGMGFLGSTGGLEYDINFDSINRSSIYNNKAANGCDLYFYMIDHVFVVVDTFTVENPTNFFASAVPHNSNITNPYTFEILHYVHTEINHDLYVSPWGNDANDGLSIHTPLQTIFRAVYNIKSDPSNPRTIHLAEGLYSRTLNQQRFPVPMKNHANLVGLAKDKVIIDVEMNTFALSISPHSKYIYISNITFQNCKGGIGSSQAENIVLNNVSIRNLSHIWSSRGFNGYRSSNLYIYNSQFSDISSPEEAMGISIGQGSGDIKLINTEVACCNSGTWMPTLQISTINDADVVIDGCSFHDNMSSAPDIWNSIMQIGPFNNNQSQRLGVKISNSAFYNNHQSNPGFMGIVTAMNDTTFVRNCTFAGNSGGSSALTVKGNAVFENNIFWNPQLPYELTAYYSSTEGISGRLEFDNNCIRNGLSGIYNMSPLNEIVWHDNNLALDPQFVGFGSHPYRLSAASPLIDIGLQPAFYEPSYDAGGNERVWDGDGDGSAVIDLGAYEYQPIASPYNLSAELWNQQILLSWQMPDGVRSLTGFRIYRNNQAYADIQDPGCRLFRDYSPVNDTLSYYMVALFGEVESEPTNSVTVIVSGVANSDETAVPAFSQGSISPNPFSDLAVISYELGKDSVVELKLYNLKGQLVRTLQQGSHSKGLQTLAWEGCDDSGRAVASGIYILQLYLDGKAVKRVKLVKC